MIMEHSGDDLLEGWSSNQTSDLMPPTLPQPGSATSSSTDGHWPGPAWTGQSLWPQSYPDMLDPLARPVPAATEGILAQQEHLRVSRRSHEFSASPTRPTAGSTTACGRSRKLSDREDTPRLERKNTKRRKTGPDRFDNYLHGDIPLPPDTTTIDVFQRYPNHITDEDTEELWRLGSSARQISVLMPEETHYNSDGVLVQQHHSLIQKKFKTFKERHETREQAMKALEAHRENGGFHLSSNTQRNLTREAQRMNSGGGRNALSPTAHALDDLPDLKFRYYPFNPPNDQAFEARMSIEIADMKSVAGHINHEDHEVRILDLLVKREFQRHGDLLKHRFIQAATCDFHQTSLYNETSKALLRKWPIPRGVPATPRTALEALRLLEHIIDQIYLHYPATADLPAKLTVFNFKHRDLRSWRVFARSLYYLVVITGRLVAESNANIPMASNGDSKRAPGLHSDTQATPGSHTTAASTQVIKLSDGRPPVRGLPSTGFPHQSHAPAYGQSPYSVSSQTTGNARLHGSRAPTDFDNPPPPATNGLPLTSSGARVIHRSAGGSTVPRSPLLTQAARTPAPLIDAPGAAVPTPAYDLFSEAKDYISLPKDGEESDNFMDQMIDWDEWDAVSIARVESSKTPN